MVSWKANQQVCYETLDVPPWWFVDHSSQMRSQPVWKSAVFSSTVRFGELQSQKLKSRRHITRVQCLLFVWNTRFMTWSLAIFRVLPTFTVAAISLDESPGQLSINGYRSAELVVVVATTGTTDVPVAAQQQTTTRLESTWSSFLIGSSATQAEGPVNTVVHTERNASIFGTGKPRESSPVNETKRTLPQFSRGQRQSTAWPEAPVLVVNSPWSQTGF